MKTRIKIIHHNDLDGYIAGTILKVKYPKAKCYCVNYDNPERFPSKEEFNENDVVFMVDFTASPEMMDWFRDNVDFYWIDHHKSSIENSSKYGWDKIKGVRKNGLCGAELTWQFVTKEKNYPKFIELVGDYDTFRKNNTPFHNEVVLPFFFGTQIYMENFNPSDYNNGFFQSFEDFKKNDIVERMIKDGKLIYKYMEKTGKIENELNCFVRDIWGYKVLCMNSCGRGSHQFTIPKTWNPELYDLMLIYYYNGNHWCYGFYTDKDDVDVSIIARKYGGGGHKGAGGATTKDLIEELK
jgi:oligoribonuclease NrnB/cAMP/cGMP phosphodiesterase (DHH superfamily)